MEYDAPELKFADISGTILLPIQALGSGTAGEALQPSLEVLNAVVEGTDAINRIGRKISMKSIQGRYIFTLQGATTGTQPAGIEGGLVRLLIVYDRSTNGSLPSSTDILQGAFQLSAVAPLNLNNRERFVVLIDEYLNLDPQNKQAGIIEFYRQLPRDVQDVIYNGGNAGTAADIQTGGIYSLWTTTIQATAGTNLGGTAYNRIRYLDE